MQTAYAASPLKITLALICLALVLSSLSLPFNVQRVQAAPAADVIIYDDALAAGWEDWSWDTTTVFNQANPVHSGTAAIAITLNVAWAGFSLRTGTPIDTATYESITFWAYDETNSHDLDLSLQSSDSGTPGLAYRISLPAGTWTQFTVSLNNLGNPAAIARINLQEVTGAAQPTFYLDELHLVEASATTPTATPTSNPMPTNTPPGSETITLNVDVIANRRPISPDIYGLNYAKESFANEIDLPVRRWGGNHTSRYNWQNNWMNHGSDWFFHNNTHYDPYTGANQSADQWIDQNERTGTASLITIPMIGYAAKDGDLNSCGFQVSKYGSQDDVDNENGYANCGNGLKGGVPLSGNDPLDTSLVITAASASDWVSHLVSTHGAADEGGVRFYALDNEPELWSETHRDVHPAPQSYDELRDKSYAYGAAIKAADPKAQIFGYAAFGWSGYWYSKYDLEEGAKNGYTHFPDYEDHGNQYQLEWYLQQMAQYEQTKGLRLLDYLDLHFYPENGVDLSLAGNAAKQALRLRSTRTLWDPTYRDESWIGAEDQPEDWQYVRLIPRMHDWVETNYPGTKLAITEYNWGGLEDINGALAQADALGIFGREGLDLATLWNYPASDLGYDDFETLPGAYAFRIYRNYDGGGARFGDISVKAASSDQSQLALYAAQNSANAGLTLIIINKTNAALTGQVTLSGFTPAATAQVYRYSPANLNAIVRQADQTVSANGFSAPFPANSITLIHLDSAQIPSFWVYLPLLQK